MKISESKKAMISIIENEGINTGMDKGIDLEKINVSCLKKLALSEPPVLI
ncbi:MAG: hypothetical protein WCP32_17950 [Bacteroidota bacterium]